MSTHHQPHWLQDIMQAAGDACRQGTGRPLDPHTARLCIPYAARIAGDARLRRDLLDLLAGGLRWGPDPDPRLIALAMAAIVQFGGHPRQRARVIRVGLAHGVVSAVISGSTDEWTFDVWVRRTAAALANEFWKGRLVEDPPAPAPNTHQTVA